MGRTHTRMVGAVALAVGLALGGGTVAAAQAPEYQPEERDGSEDGAEQAAEAEGSAAKGDEEAEPAVRVGAAAQDEDRPEVLRGDLVVFDAGPTQLSPYLLFQGQVAPFTGDENLIQDGDPAENVGARIRRARLGFEGWAFGAIDYGVIVDAAAENVQLLDAYVGYRPFPFFGFRLGAAKVPFSRFALMSSSRQTMTERPLSVSAMAPFRQVGITFEGEVADGLVSYAAGVYNGFERNANFHEGYSQNPSINGNRFNDLAYAGRVTLEPLGSVGDSLADLDKGPLRIAAGTGLYYNDGETTQTTGWEADALLQVRGFHLAAEYLADTAEPARQPTTDATIPTSVDRFALVGEMGYVILADQLGVSFRTELIDDNEALDDNGDEVVVAGGVEYYLHRQHVKAQLDYTHRQELNGPDRDNDTLLLQLQIGL